MGGQPRVALGRSLTGRGVRQWLAAIALNAEIFVADRENRRQLVKDICESVGVGKGRSREVARQRLQQLLDEPRRRARGVEADVEANVATLGQFLDLTAVEQDVLRFAAMLRVDDNLAVAAGHLEPRTEQSFTAALGRILGHAAGDVRRALEWGATLVEHQLFECCDGYWSLGDRLQMKAALGRRLAGRRTGIDELVRGYFAKAPAPTLRLSDFAHMADDVRLVLDYIAKAAAKGEVGINVLLYGLPGTGKTELSRLAARELGWAGFEVATEEDGEAATAKSRIASYRMAQRYLAKRRRCLVVVDELEDVFGSGDEFGGMFSAAKPFGKAWMNRALEGNAVPTIWIANRLDAVDPAHLRRFDLSLRFGMLPRAVRTRMIEKHVGGFVVDARQLADLHARSEVLPSQVAMAAKVARSVAKRRRAGDAFIRALDASMRLLGQAIPDAGLGEGQFDIGLVNASTSIGVVVNGLVEGGGRGRLLLTGPPGSGKSAFARHVATLLRRDARVVSASALLSPFVGDTVRRIALEFEHAADHDCILVWEGVEALLRPRDVGAAGWEHAIADEMLERMERFEGLAFFTTNAPSMLDVAARRRFDLTVAFGYLRMDQRLRLWNAMVGAAGGKAGGAPVERLARMERLTPGDFVAVGRRAVCIGGRWEPQEWLAALEEEHGMKQGGVAAIGFVTEQ